MTAKESASIAKLRDELHSYHIEVREHIARCEACRGDVVKMSSDLYGRPGAGAGCGLMGAVASLDRSRRLATIGIRSLWVLFSGLTVAVVGAVARKFLG